MAENAKPVEAPSPLRGALRSARRALLALLILAALWTLWYAYAAVRLNARLRAYRAHGDPTTGRDLVSAPVPAGADARILIESAWRELRCTQSEERVLYDGEFPLTPGQLEVMSALLARDGAAIELLREARGEDTLARPATWPIDPEKLMNSPFGEISDLMDVVDLCRCAAFYCHQIARDDEVYQWLRDLETCADVFDRGPTLLHHRHAAATRRRMADVLLHLAPSLTVRSETTLHGMPRDEVVALINYLLDEAPSRRGLRTGYAQQRVFILALDNADEHDTWLLRPAIQLDACRALRRVDAFVNAFEAPEMIPFAELLARLPSFSSGSSNLDLVALRSSNKFEHDTLNIFSVYESFLYTRAAALSLALRLCKIDHGKFPATLAELVPAYVPSIPGDLFDPAGRPFVYLPAAHLFYSVGEDGIDGGGNKLSFSVLNFNAHDFVVPLDP